MEVTRLDITREWTMEEFYGYDHDGATIWKPVATGRSRLRAAIVVLICTFAKPNAMHRLRWGRLNLERSYR